MCIRDRIRIVAEATDPEDARDIANTAAQVLVDQNREFYSCLLYTSDAADERSSVDLGGRRIIKKKKHIHTHTQHHDTKQLSA